MNKTKKTKIAIVGAPSCRKTTVSEQLNVTLKNAKHNSEVVREYAREYIANYGPPGNVFEQYLIAQKQIDAEKTASEIHDIVICDSASFLSYIYASNFASLTSKDLFIKAEIYKTAMEHMKTYDFVFYFPKSEAMRDDGLRYQTDEETSLICQQVKYFMLTENIKYIECKGSVDQKVNKILNTLVNRGIIDRNPNCTVINTGLTEDKEWKSTIPNKIEIKADKFKFDYQPPFWEVPIYKYLNSAYSTPDIQVGYWETKDKDDKK